MILTPGQRRKSARDEIMRNFMEIYLRECWEIICSIAQPSMVVSVSLEDSTC